MSARIKIFLFGFLCIVLASCAGKEKDGAKKEEAQPTTSLSLTSKEQKETVEDVSGDIGGEEKDPVEKVPSGSINFSDLGESFNPPRDWGSAQNNTSLPPAKDSDKPLIISGQEAIIYRGSVPVITYAFDADNNLYAVIYQSREEGGYSLLQYDASQKLQCIYEFYDPKVDINNSLVGIEAIAAYGRTVYFAANYIMKTGEVCMALYTLDLDTRKIQVLAEFSCFDTVRKMLFKDGMLYLLGTKRYSADPYQPGGADGYTFYEDQIISYRISDGVLGAIKIDHPISMAFAENGKLMVYAYESGYCLLEYDPAQASIETVTLFSSYFMQDFAICHNGKDIIYSYSHNSRGLVLAPLDAMAQETELCPAEFVGSALHTQILFLEGKVYLLNKDRNIMGFTISDTYQNNTAIRYISPGYQPDAPYGCGYAMERQELSKDKFVLKVLARDADYDLCLIDSLDDCSYNLKKNGVFYPLNDVPGVREYLKQCFPYVEEAAIKEDGTVWMLPIAVYMPGLIVQEDTLKKLKVPLAREMTWEEFASVFANLTAEQRELIAMSRTVCTMQFFQQYFKKYTSVDQEVFRQSMEALKQLDKEMKLIPYREDKKYLFYYERYMRNYTNPAFRESYYGEDAKIYPMPKLSAGDVNTASCIILAVNPESDRLEETLNFIEDYVAWQMKGEAPPFFKEPVPAKGSFEADLYALYENGEIAFDIDKDVYMEGIEKVLDGQKDVEEYIRETEKKIKIYFGE